MFNLTSSLVTVAFAGIPDTGIEVVTPIGLLSGIITLIGPEENDFTNVEEDELFNLTAGSVTHFVTGFGVTVGGEAL